MVWDFALLGAHGSSHGYLQCTTGEGPQPRHKADVSLAESPRPNASHPARKILVAPRKAPCLRHWRAQMPVRANTCWARWPQQTHMGNQYKHPQTYDKLSNTYTCTLRAFIRWCLGHIPLPCPPLPLEFQTGSDPFGCFTITLLMVQRKLCLRQLSSYPTTALLCNKEAPGGRNNRVENYPDAEKQFSSSSSQEERCQGLRWFTLMKGA